MAWAPGCPEVRAAPVEPVAAGCRRSWVVPRLVDVRDVGRPARVGDSGSGWADTEQLEAAAPALAAAADAVSYRVRSLSPSVVEVTLVLRDVLSAPASARMPDAATGSELGDPGRAQDGSPWRLPLRGRHTLVVGCSGAGKGSCCGASPPASALRCMPTWCACGASTSSGVWSWAWAQPCSTRSLHPGGRDELLAALLTVIDQRAAALVGRSRLHEPSPGDPLHVLVIDELAALIGYADADTRRDAGRLLSEILTQGRALGVVVVALVQDPRKETVGMRGLFTQTVALRLRSAEETRMVLGDGMAAGAGAPDQPGRTRNRLRGQR